MPLVTTTLPDVTQSVMRPVVNDVANQIKQATKIPDDVPLYYPNDEGYITSAGTGLDNKDDRFMRSTTQRRLEVTATEKYAEDQQITDSTGYRDNSPVFVDRPLNVWIAPSYTSSEVTLELSFYTKSKEEARQWRDDVTQRYLQGRYALDHTVTYSFNLPQSCWNLIYQIYKKREHVAGYNETFKEWMQKCTTNRLIWISDEVGKNLELTVAERQLRIQGFFGFTNEPEKAEYDTATGLYLTRFSYRFVYQRAAGVDMSYPVIVHQQLLDAPFIDFVNKEDRYPDIPVHRSQWQWSLKPMEMMEIMEKLKPQYPFIRIPYVDDFAFNYAFPGTGAYLTVLLSLKCESDRKAFNLKNLGKTVIDPDILDFLEQGEYKYIGAPGKSIFHFDLFTNKDLRSPGAISLDKDLNVLLNVPIDMRRPYRVRCALFTDLGFIDRAALDRLAKHPKAFQKVFGAINDLLRIDSSFQKLGEQRHIYPWQLTRLYEAVTGQALCNIYTGRARSYNGGAWGTNWLNQQRTFLSDIPPNVLRAYRQIRRTRMDTQLFGIASWNAERDLKAAQELKLA